MAVTIRLSRAGTKKRPIYRLVVTDSRTPRGGRFLENIGTYDPRRNEGIFTLKSERLDYWKSVGAQTSDTVARLIKGHVKAQGAAKGEAATPAAASKTAKKKK